MPSELWQRVFSNSPKAGDSTPDEQTGRWEESASGSKMASHGSGQEMLQRQEQAMNEVRDMEFEIIGRQEAERVLREQQLQVMSQHSEKLEGHSAMLERVLAQQRILHRNIMELSTQHQQVIRSIAKGGQGNSSAPAPPVMAPAEPQAAKIEAPVVEALHKIEAKMQEMQKSMEKAASAPVAAPTRKTDEAEVVVEFGGLWYEGKAKHVISGKFLHDAAGNKWELEIYNQREFTANGTSLGHAHIAKDGQCLVWSSGRVWTRAPKKKQESLQARLQGKQSSAGKQAAQSGPPTPTHQGALSVRTSSNRSVNRAYEMPWSKHVTLPEELTGIQSIFGDSLRDHASYFDEDSRISRFLLRVAAFADWMEVQHRVPMPQETRLDRVVQSVYFEFLSAFLIMANAVYIGYTTNWFMENPLEESTTLMTLMDVAFTALFTLELGLRACSLRNMFFFGPDALWYCFDIILIAISLGELFAGSSGTFSFLRTLRVFKLARVIRMVRTLRLFNELRLLLDCMLGSLNSLCWCLLVIAFVFYLFALILVQGLAGVLGDIERELSNSQLQREATGDEIKARWGSVSLAMLRLWEATTGGVDWEMEYNLVSTAGFFHSAVFIGFIAFMLIVVWNIVTSTILEKALRFAQPDIDQLLMDKRRRDNEDVEVLLAMLQKAGIEVTQKITEEEFMVLLAQKDMADFLQVRGIDIKEAHTFFALINEDASSEGVDTTSFIAMCLRIKGFATSIDLHTIHYQTLGILKRQGQLLTDTIRSLHDLNNTVHLQKEEVASETSGIFSTVLGGGFAAHGSNITPE